MTYSVGILSSTWRNQRKTGLISAVSLNHLINSFWYNFFASLINSNRDCLWLFFGIMTNAKKRYNTKYGKTYLKIFPNRIRICERKFILRMAPPKIILCTRLGYISANCRIKMVPSEMPTKCVFSILRWSKTSKISLAKAENVYFFWNASFSVGCELPWPRRSNSKTLKCFWKSRICLNQIEELPPAPWTKVTHWSLDLFGYMV